MIFFLMATFELSINLPSVSHSHDLDCPRMIVNLTDHPIIPDSDSPIFFGTRNFMTSRRSGIYRQSLEMDKDSLENGHREISKVLFGRFLKINLMHLGGIPPKRFPVS